MAEAMGTGQVYQVTHDTTLTVSADEGVLADDFSPSGDSLAAQIVTGPSSGTLDLDSDGAFEYTPSAGFTGSDSFVYEPHDGSTALPPQTVFLSVTNTKPFSYAAEFTVLHDQVLADQLTGIDHDNDALTYAVTSFPSVGTLSVNSYTGAFTYTPPSHFRGDVSFDYHVVDSLEQSEDDTVTIKVTNYVPVGAADAYAVTHDRTLTVSAAGVLANDRDYDGDALAATLATAPSHGSVSLAGNGSFVYTPTAGYVGEDTFWYTPSDGVEAGDPTPVVVSVVNHTPVAITGVRTFFAGSTASGTVGSADGDGDTLTATLLSGPSAGTLVWSNGSYQYTTGAFTAPIYDSFTYKLSDGVSESNVGTVFLSKIGLVTAAPVALGNAYAMLHDRVLNGSAPGAQAAAGTEEGPPPLISVKGSDPQHGTLMFNSNMTFTYTPNAGYTGTDVFTYYVTNGYQTSNTDPVVITVTNQAPVLRADAFATDQFGEINSTVAANDDDLDGDNLVFTAVSAPPSTAGNLVFHSNGTFVFTPLADFVGTVSFTYQATDGVVTTPPVRAYLSVIPGFPLGTLEISNGMRGAGGGQVIQPSARREVGAVTVANLNDTDADGVVDKDDNDIAIQNAANVEGAQQENDMMLLRLRKPVVLGLNQLPPGTLFRADVSGEARLWKEHSFPENGMPQDRRAQSKRSGRAPDTFTLNDFNPQTNDIRVYVEATAPSALRGITITYQYLLPGQAVWKTLDQVKATAVWVTREQVWRARANVSPANLIAQPLRDLLDVDKSAVDGSTVGLGTYHPETPQGGTPADTMYGGRILFEYKATPSGADELVDYDVTRRVKTFQRYLPSGAGQASWRTPDAQAGLPDKTNWPRYADGVNDDNVSIDEQNDICMDCSNDRMYSYDSPSFPPLAALVTKVKKDFQGHVPAFAVFRANYEEFVRVMPAVPGQHFVHAADVGETGTLPPTGIQGSRGSLKDPWFVSMHLKWNGTTLVEDNTPVTVATPQFIGGNANGTMSVDTFADTTTLGISASFNAATTTWTVQLVLTDNTTVQKTINGQGGAALFLTAGGANLCRVTITAGANQFQNNDSFNTSVYKTALQNGKQNEINTGWLTDAAALTSP